MLFSSKLFVLLFCFNFCQAWKLGPVKDSGILRASFRVFNSPSNRQAPPEGTMFKSPAFRVLDFLFSIPLVHDTMFGIYRRQIVEKAERMGLPWRQYMEEQREALPDLSATAARLHNPNTTIPQYFHAPVHAYKEGNLCWESAMEEDLWSKLMIAPLFDNALDGDVRMRRQWLAITARAVTMPPQTATDLGCGTGLSMYMLDSKWPSLQRVVGVDLSTFKLSVCEEKKAFMPSLKASKYQLRHEAAEGTSQPDNSQDLVTFCLVAHESPKDVSKAIFAEAFRILRPGGVFTMLDLDKNNLEVLLENPFVAAIYKRTEPYMSEFLLLEPTHDLVEAGFEMVEADNASKSHRVFVARKPCL